MPQPERAPPTRGSDDVAGLGLSGGGIRSATFNLGVLQALARERWLRRVDFLSTVSGGGYIGVVPRALVRPPSVGCALGRRAGAGQLGRRSRRARADRSAIRRQSRWLRKHGNYIAPSGEGDARATTPPSFLRNFLSVHFVVGAPAVRALRRGQLRSATGVFDPATASSGLGAGSHDATCRSGTLLKAVLGAVLQPVVRRCSS